MAQTKLNNSQLPDIIQGKTIDTSNDIDTTTTKLTITGGTNGQVLSTDGSGNLSWTTAGGGAQIQVDTFTSSGTWTKPSWAKRVEVYLVGAGGGGASGTRNATSAARTAGGAGGAGAISVGYFNASLLGATESVSIGAGGTGGSAVTTDSTKQNAGNDGGSTQFGSHFQAPGGGGGISPAGVGQTSIGGTTYVSYGAPLFMPNNSLTGTGAILAPNGSTGSGQSGLNNDWTRTGGGGGGANVISTTTANGGNGGGSRTANSYYLTSVSGGAGGTVSSRDGANGSGNTLFLGYLELGVGGGGGAYVNNQVGGNGGNGSNYGAGGGGGGASNNGYNSGAGGNGSGGIAVVVSIG